MSAASCANASPGGMLPLKVCIKINLWRLVPLKKLFLISLFVLLCEAHACASQDQPANGAAGQSYSTTFNYTENPISNGGNWVSGGSVGLDWGDIQTNGSMAFGVSIPVNYGDATAVLSGTWGPTQDAKGVVNIVSLPTQTLEVEIRVRTTITAHSITGYEIDCSLNPSNPFLLIVRWDGPVGNFTPLTSNAPVYCKQGDTLEATANGSTITAIYNGTTEVTATDTTYGTGSIGIGFYGPGPFPASSYLTQFGFSAFSASATGGGLNITASNCIPTDLQNALNQVTHPAPPFFATRKSRTPDFPLPAFRQKSRRKSRFVDCQICQS